MIKQHLYSLQIQWTGNTGQGTTNYRSYERSHTIAIEGKPVLECSSDTAFLGDKTKYNPEDLLVASLAACHMLWYLHLCAESGVVVLEYIDMAKGTMAETSEGGGHFTEVTLYPKVTVLDQQMVHNALQLHQKANELCFIAKSVNFPVYHHPECMVRS